MSKNICEVCGESYPENATQCPFCGATRSGERKPLTESAEKPQAPKGGKFAKLKENIATRTKKSSSSNGNDSSNLPMIVIVTVLLLAIVSVCVFIAIRFMDKPTPDASSVPSSSASQSTEPTVAKVPCTGIELVNNDTKTLSFTAATESAKLTMKALPENTTDNVTYSFVSSDPSVVLVDQTGFVTPVSTGKATITVSYGSFSVTVDVDVKLPIVVEKLVLNQDDFTLSPTNGLTFKLVSLRVPAEDIIWTSSDESVVTVENGVVTAVGNGKATITAVYGELKTTCIARVSGVNGGTSTSDFALTDTDVTLVVGEKFTLKLKDKNTNETVKGVTWNFSPEFASFCTKAEIADGVVITASKVTIGAASGGYVRVTGEHNGETFTCIVRVKAGPAAG